MKLTGPPVEVTGKRLADLKQRGCSLRQGSQRGSRRFIMETITNPDRLTLSVSWRRKIPTCYGSHVRFHISHISIQFLWNKSKKLHFSTQLNVDLIKHDETTHIRGTTDICGSRTLYVRYVGMRHSCDMYVYGNKHVPQYNWTAWWGTTSYNDLLGEATNWCDFELRSRIKVKKYWL